MFFYNMISTMRKKLILFIVLLILFGAFIGVRYIILDAQNASGRVKILSSPSAGVFIDNVAVGKTPLEAKYKVGEFLLKLIPEGDATATASWQGKIKVYKNSLTYVNRELGSSDITSAGETFTANKMDKSPSNPNYGEVYVETDPNGAIVYLDNDEKGVAPLILGDVLKGDHELSVFMPGFFRRTQKINVDAGYRVNASFKLSIDQSQQKPTDTPTPVQATASAKVAPGSTGVNKIIIKETPLGYLRVREEPTLNASVSGQVNPGEQFDILDEKEGWYKIKFTGKEGWVSSQYSEKAK